MIFIHAADLHLGSPLGGLDQHDQLPARRIRQAPMRAFERLAELCESRGAGLLVVAGDLFDGNADLATMREAAQVLARITGAGTRVITIRGNHDADSRMQLRMPTIDGLEQLPTAAPGSVVLEELGVAVHGRGFDTPRVTDNIVPTYPAPVEGLLNVGLLHTSLAGAAGHDSYAPCSVADLAARGYGYWALGHVHQREVVSDSPWIVYPGNTQGRDVGECGPRGATVVEYAEGHVVGRPEHADLDEVRWHVLGLDVGPLEGAQELVARAEAQLVELVAAAPDKVHVVRVRIGGRGLAHEELASEPGRWRTGLHEATFAISPDALYLEHVHIRTRPALPERAELLARDDFIGDAARRLLAIPPLAPTPLDGDALSALERKLAQLPRGSGESLLAPVAQDEIDAAREALVSRLLVAHAEDVEVTR